jgi:transcription elongation factor Elf1
MINRGKTEFKPIEKDERKADRQYFCVACGSVATQTAHIKIEGAIIIERYCDACASKESNQTTSGT